MLHLAVVLALTSAVAPGPVAQPAPSPLASPASPVAMAAPLPGDGASEVLPATEIRVPANADAPKHAIVQFPWTRYTAARQQSAAMEAEIDAVLNAGLRNLAAKPLDHE